MSIPEVRIRTLSEHQVRRDGDYVLYWMIAFRRVHWNFTLDRAVELARKWDRPLVIFEALGCGYAWACDRFHRFVMDGMVEKIEALADAPVHYYPYVEPELDADKGLLVALAERACAVVTDEFPCFFLPRMVASAAKKIPARLEAVDSNGLLPLRAADQVFSTAHAFRRFLQKNLPHHLEHFPKRDPLARLKLPTLKALPEAVTKRWPAATKEWLTDPTSLAALPINHGIGPAAADAAVNGGEAPARKLWSEFLKSKLDGYGDERNEPAQEVTSGLSPYLHFGFISSHQMFPELMERENWSKETCSACRRIAHRLVGRECECRAVPRSVHYVARGGVQLFQPPRRLRFLQSLPDWARETLAKHADDERAVMYTLKDFAAARTQDTAVERSATPVDGRRPHPRLHAHGVGQKNPGMVAHAGGGAGNHDRAEQSLRPRRAKSKFLQRNFLVPGRYYRPWGPERPIFGKVRYMSSGKHSRGSFR